MDGVSEPDPDRGDVDGSAPDEVAFVVAGGDGAVLAELAEGTFDGVALLVSGGVEGGWAAARAAAADPVAGLVGGFRDGGLDAALAQVDADRGGGVRLVAQDLPGPGPCPATARRASVRRSMSGRNASESWRWPPLVTRASGGHPEPASRWILLVRPPRDRPSASRFLSFGSAPDAGRGAQLRRRQPHPVNIGRRDAPGPGRVLVRPHHRGIYRHRPPLPFRPIAPRAQTVQNHLPGPIP